MAGSAQCQALNVSDETICLENATSQSGLFCSFHARQCRALYLGYKKRNAHLDKLEENPPPYLAESKIALVNNTFSDVHTEQLCHELHDHLFLRFQLLNRVIGARKLHNSRFYASDNDYGHEQYVNQLQGQKNAVVKALERLERRTSEVLYKSQKWYTWVRQCQQAEEENREKEQKKIKQEAALFKRHWKAAEHRIKEAKDKENQKRQDEFLDQVHKERQAETENEETDDPDFDPIEDVLEDNRGNFIALFHRFLWMAEQENASENIGSVDNEKTTESAPVDAEIKTPLIEGLETGSSTTEGVEPGLSGMMEAGLDDGGAKAELENPITETAKPSHSKKKKGKSKKGGKKASKPKIATNEEKTAVSSQTLKLALASGPAIEVGRGKQNTESKQKVEIDKNHIETREETLQRLKLGSEYSSSSFAGRLVGSIDNPVMQTRTHTYDDDEIEQLLNELAEIKHLLFCRLLLGHASLLPAALRADSVEEFLADENIPAADLRDLCLKMEFPSLQDIRDACADLFRSDDEEGDNTEETEVGELSIVKEDSEDRFESADEPRIFKKQPQKGELPEKWISKREQAKASANSDKNLVKALEQGEEGTAVNFGKLQNGPISRKIRVKVCGRYIWNYPSDKAMNRGGWLHYCIIAKDSTLHDAIELCRHWDEFFELNILACWLYFPGAEWTTWVGNRYRQQMLQLGFILYMESAEPDAMDMMEHYASGGTGRHGNVRRSHHRFEARNFMCAHIKRDDQVSRRFVQYLSMSSHRLVVLVRDAESGNLLITPPEEERWLYREKRGLGRASKNSWTIIKQIGPEFFEEMDRHRSWRFGFKEVYDIYIWDYESGLPFPALYNTVQEIIFKAHRFTKGQDLYNPQAEILKTLYRDEAGRIRDIKPGDTSVESIYDSIHHEGTKFIYGSVQIKNTENVESANGEPVKRQLEENLAPRHLWYSKADALEDKVLFPEELSQEGIDPLEIGKFEPLQRWMDEGLSLNKFVENRMFESDSDFETDSNTDLIQNIAEDVDEDEDYEGSSNGGSDQLEQDLDYRGGANLSHLHPLRDMDQIIEKITNGQSSEENVELMNLLKKRGTEKRPARDPGDPKVMHEDFIAYMDKEKAKMFKIVWHNADLEPLAQARYVEMKTMAKYSRRFNQSDYRSAASKLGFQLLDSLDVPRGQDSRDLYKAIAKMAPFFHREFFDYKNGQRFKDSLLFNQDERSKSPPELRSHLSNTFRPRECWNEFDKECEKMESEDDLDALPEEWDITIRPIIAHLYKSGVIRNRANTYYAGQAVAAKDVGSDKYDLFIDFRSLINTVRMPPGIEDPASVPAFKTSTSAFAAKHPNARFAILKIWSSAYFYPLMVGHDNHDPTSFRDLYGRNWIWMFVPKDMPNSEWSIHISGGNRIKPFQWYMKDRVICKRDAYLVMGTDEKDLFRLASATTYSIQNRPWRWEVDLWKSWINVDNKFVQELDDRWLA